jgi:hypothetical protein
MPVQTEHRFPLDLSVLDAAGSRVTLADLRGQARAVAVYFMRTGTCPVCIPPRPRPGPAGPTHPRRAVVVVPGPPTHAARVRRILGDRVTVVSSDGAQAHLAAGLHPTLLLQHSRIMLIDAAGVVRYRLATALPTGSFDGPTLQAAIDRP